MRAKAGDFREYWHLADMLFGGLYVRFRGKADIERHGEESPLMTLIGHSIIAHIHLVGLPSAAPRELWQAAT